MGSKSATETTLGLLVAFTRKRRWAQAELARDLGVSVPALRKRLVEASTLIPLRDTKIHPHVYWEVPKSWIPSGAALEPATISELVRLLARAPQSSARDRLLRGLVEKNPTLALPEHIQTTSLGKDEQDVLPTLEDAVASGSALRMKYFSQHRAQSDWRYVSVASVIPGPPTRFLAVCHRSNELKFFRAANVAHAELSHGEPYRRVDANEVLQRVQQSVDGWFAGTGGEVSFIVRANEARWVTVNLLEGMRAEPLTDGRARIVSSAAGLPNIARFVVGLGDAATSESAVLTAAVRALAEGALRSHSPLAHHRRTPARKRTTT